MNSQTTNQTTQQTGSPTAGRAECCSELKCEDGLRNNYFVGKRLTPDSFRVEQRYMLERRHLLNRAIHGWGVVYGYGVNKVSAPEHCQETKAGRLRISAGLALDQYGRELLQSETLLEFADVILLNANGARMSADDASAARLGGSVSPPTCWLLSVHYAEQSTDPVTLTDSCSCEHHEWDHTCETVRYSLKPVPCKECCKDFDCELNCACGTGHCCGGAEHAGMEQAGITQTAKLSKRGGCNCLCEHLTKWAPEGECGSLCEIEEACARVRVDLRHGVPLACLKLAPDASQRLTFGEVVEACGPRRLVKRNDLLFDLIRGCDLTRISEISWSDWHRNRVAINFDEFSKKFGPEGNRLAEYLTNFEVKFSHPVREDTLRPACFAMTIICYEREGGWWQTFRVPIVRLELTPHAPADPVGHRRGARIVVDGAWVEDGLRGRGSVFIDSETRVEIEVRGDFIVDCNGQTVDANAVGLSPAPTGNGTPGGTFLSTFRVAKSEGPLRPSSYNTADPSEGGSL